MKTKMKKYPLLLSMVISCTLIIASLFILGFFGMNLGTSLGGGSQFEITMPNNVSQTSFVEKVKDAVSDEGFKVETTFVEDKYIATEEVSKYTTKVLVVKIAKTDISDSKKADIKEAVAEKLKIDENQISNIETITSVVKAKNVLYLGLAIGIIMVCLFVMAWIRYDILAGLSFVLAFLHNAILYLSVLILTRIQLNLVSLGVILVLTLVMSAILIQIYEKNREESKSKTSEKQTITERMIASEITAIKPFVFVAGAVAIFAGLLFFVPVLSVTFTAVNILMALVVTAYSGLLVGPGVYSALLEIKDYRHKAILSRNDTINKVIKKKVKKNTVKKDTSKK